MSKATTALLFGHSHVWSLQRAIATNEFTPANPDFSIETILCGTQRFPGTLLIRSSTGAEQINPALIGALADYPAIARGEERWLVSAVQGNYYNVVGMLDEGTRFDFMVPGYEHLPLDTSGVILPYGAVAAAVLSAASELAPFFQRLSKLGYFGVVHLGAPPPNPSEDAILKQIASDPNLANRALSVTSPTTRLKLWLTQEYVLQDICKRNGVKYLSAPRGSRDSAGFLVESQRKDAVHGNSAYATLVLRDLERLIMQP
jgi:hypothetical protein